MYEPEEAHILNKRWHRRRIEQLDVLASWCAGTNKICDTFIQLYVVYAKCRCIQNITDHVTMKHIQIQL
jgi:hypothetical protein